MKEKEIKKDESLEKLNKFLRQNREIDWQAVNLINTGEVSLLNWKGIEDDVEQVTKQIKAYQRLYRVLEEDNPKLIRALLKKNIHSAIQIAAMSEKQFMSDCAKTFKNDKEHMEKVYKKAVTIRSQLLAKYMEQIQNNEPHVAQVKTL